mgnify:CR=1 FL=1
MRLAMKIVSAIGLGLTIVPSLLVFLNVISWQTHADLMTAGMVIWFASAPAWMKLSRT